MFQSASVPGLESCLSWSTEVQSLIDDMVIVKKNEQSGCAGMYLGESNVGFPSSTMTILGLEKCSCSESTSCQQTLGRLSVFKQNEVSGAVYLGLANIHWNLSGGAVPLVSCPSPVCDNKSGFAARKYCKENHL